MSATVDDRIVSMQFDNKAFENNVQTSISTLDKLKKSLNLTGAAKGFDGIQTSANNTQSTFKELEYNACQAGFSLRDVWLKTSQIFEYQVAGRMVSSAKNLAKAFTIDPIKTGLSEYETQINAVQTILANTESKGTTLTDVNGALDELNKYADKTIYNFTEMTRNIGTFTAAGVDLDTSVNAIQGIANLAAVSGSSSQQASTAMYQLSQALSSGTVKLMDWNSVVNAGMGGQVFQDALKETARVHGIAIDDMIEENGSFRETLQEGWLTSDILTETLQKFTMATEGLTEAEIEANREMLRSKGYSEEQIDNIFKLGDTATNAATKVKTFTQLMDTLKESAQSGWTQTWEILIGDFEEAKELWTSVSDVFGGIINSSSEARNNMLQGWADDGGRQKAIDGIKSAFQGLVNIATPIKEAFREIFPATTSKQLINITDKFKSLMERFAAFTEKHGPDIKATFKGIFAAMDIVKTVASKLLGAVVKLLGSVLSCVGGLLKFTGVIGNWITGVRDAGKEATTFGDVVDGIVGFLQKAIDKIKEFFSVVGEKFLLPGFEGFFTLINGIAKIIQKLGSKIRETFTNAFQSGDLGKGMDLLNGGLLAVLLLGIKKFVNGLKDAFEGATGLLDNVKDILGSVGDCFKAWQQDLQAKTLLKIAAAIAILAAAIVVIAMIDPVKLAASLGAITVLFGDLLASLAIFSKMGGGMKGTFAATTAMIGMSTAVLILAIALKKVSDIKTEDLLTSLLGIMALTAIVVKAAKALSKNTGEVVVGATTLVGFALAVKILASACTIMAKLSWEEMAKGLLGVAAIMAAVTIAANCLPKNTLTMGIGLLGVATAMLILSGALKIMGSMSWEEIGRGLVVLGASLVLLAVGLTAMVASLPGAAALAVASTGLLYLAVAMKVLGTMSWEDIGKGLLALGGALVILAVGLTAMIAALPGAAALLVAAGALAILAPVLLIFGNMSWESIAKGLVMIAGAFTIMGVAGLLLGPMVPVLLGLSGAMALLGVGAALVGAGVLALSAGFAALAVSGSAGVAALVSIVTSLAALIPMVATQIALGMVAFAQAIVKGAPVILNALSVILIGLVDILIKAIPKVVQAATILVVSLLDAFIQIIPKMVEAGMKIVLGVLEGIASNIGQIAATAVEIVAEFIRGVASQIGNVIDAGMDLIISFVEGLADGIRNNTDRMIKAMEKLMDSMIYAASRVLKLEGVSELLASGKKLIGGLISGITSTISKVVTTILDLMSKAINAVKGFVSKFINAGKDVVSGLADGIKSGVKKVTNAAKSLGEKALGGLKKLLGIKSPSREFKKVGKWCDEGLVKGLKSYSGKVVTAAEGVGSSALNSMKNTIGGLANLIDPSINSQPTIRPVLDLSAVESGAGTINGMFNDSLSLGVMPHIGAINTMMSRRQIQNGNDDVVSAINELKKTVSDSAGDTYNFDRITYDDGSNIADAVKSLVRAVKMEGRV